MFNLTSIIAEMTPTDWALALACVALWVASIHFAGVASEKRWGDRESGALAGFFIPGFLLIALLYLW